MRTSIMVQPELARIANELILAAPQPDVVGISVMGGDRISCCDEGVVGKKWGRIIGLATIAPLGEDYTGQPTIVGVYIRKEYRRRGVGRALLTRAIGRCVERGFEKIRIDAVTKGGMRLVDALPPELREKLDVHDVSQMWPFEF